MSLKKQLVLATSEDPANGGLEKRGSFWSRLHLPSSMVLLSFDGSVCVLQKLSFSTTSVNPTKGGVKKKAWFLNKVSPPI